MATAINSTMSRAVSSSERSMSATVPTRMLPFQRRRPRSPYVRLAEELGYAREKTARDNVARPYLQVAITNRVLLEAGLSSKVGELMAVVEASMMGEPLPLKEAIDRHNLCDAAEDLAQAEFIKNAGDVELEAWIKKLATDLYNGETLLKCLITERDKRRAAK